MSFLKELTEFVFNSSNHLIAIGPKLDGNTLHIKATPKAWTAIFYLNWFTCSTGFVWPLYMVNIGWWNRLGRFAFSIHHVRAVHGSVRVGFVPNPEPTRPDRLARNSTRRRPAWLIGSGGSDLQQTAVGSVGGGDLKIAQNQAI